MANYDDVLVNFRERLTEFNARKLVEAKGEAALSDAEFGRVMIHMDDKSVYESAKILRDKYVLALDNGKTVYLDFFSSDTDRNIYQVTHQVTMDKAHKGRRCVQEPLRRDDSHQRPSGGAGRAEASRSGNQRGDQPD